MELFPSHPMAAIPKVIYILSALLQRVADRNDDAARGSRALVPAAAAAFQGLTKPAISVQSYLERISRYAPCAPECFVAAYIYLDRYTKRHPAVAINSLNVHRFFLASLLAAVKFLDDRRFNNAYFAKVGGISLVEMNYLELDFLFGVDFRLLYTPTIFDSYCCMLQGEGLFLESPPAPLKSHCVLTELEDPGDRQEE